jgi:hypothetical protein
LHFVCSHEAPQNFACQFGDKKHCEFEVLLEKETKKPQTSFSEAFLLYGAHDLSSLM